MPSTLIGALTIGVLTAGTLATGPRTIRTLAGFEAGSTDPTSERIPSSRLSQQEWERATSAELLALLPDGEAKRAFILDCTGCHQFDQRTTTANGRLRNEAEWAERIRQMLAFAGASTGFPIISPSRHAETTASWLVEHLGGPDDPLPDLEPPRIPRPTPPATITEFDLPDPNDLPHDLMLAAKGQVVVTGMFTHRLYVLDPATGSFQTQPIPVPDANPRAAETDRHGRWWVLLGGPQKVARFDPESGAWSSWDLGMYPHSIGLDAQGRVWFNGHFTKEPELLGSLDPATGKVSTAAVPVPVMPDGGSTIPYELRVGSDGTVWMTELRGNRLVRFDPATQSFRLYELPTPHSGPRRFDLDAHGVVWVPEYAGNKLARFDPRTESFTEYEFPLKDALPYVVRADHTRGVLWIGTAAADVVARFDPRTRTFDVYPLPTQGALIRHLVVDPRTGAVWGAYSPVPARSPKIVRITPG